MATPASADGEPWHAHVAIFSGRPDPAWTLSASTAELLERAWSTLAPLRGATMAPPVLGYRGCVIASPAGEWIAYGGVVTLTTARGQEARADPARVFERIVLDAAPPGVVPIDALRREFDPPL